MIRMMNRTALSATLIAALFAAQGVQAEPAMVKEIEVDTDLSAISNAKAAAYWGHLSQDLQAAIAARLVGRLGEEGAKITVDIDEIALTNTFANVITDQDAILKGTVHVSNPEHNSQYQSYDLTTSSHSALSHFPGGKLPDGAFRDSPVYYAALIDSFADTVVAKLD